MTRVHALAAEAEDGMVEGSPYVCCVRKLESPDFVTEVMFVGWETRERGGWYFTRSKWVNGRVVREYVGTGAIGKTIALDDELKRLQKEEEVARWREERECLEQSAAFLQPLAEVAEVLTRAHLLADGCHRPRRQWRRRREHRA